MCIEIIVCQSSTIQSPHNTTYSTPTDTALLRPYSRLKHAHKNANSHRLISTELSEIVQSSVHQLTYKTVSIITSPMQQNTHH